MTLDVRAEVIASPNGKLLFYFSQADLMYNEAVPEAVDKIIAALGLQEGDEVGIAFMNPSVGQVQGNDYPMTPLRLAGIFHDVYARLAPSYGYKIGPETREFRPASENVQLMIAVCKEVLAKLECDHSEITVILADVPPDRRMEIGRLLGETRRNQDHGAGHLRHRFHRSTGARRDGIRPWLRGRHRPGGTIYCQRCKSTRLLDVSAKASDCMSLRSGEYEHRGEMLDDVNLGGGYYVRFTVGLDCGQVQGEYPLPMVASLWEG